MEQNQPQEENQSLETKPGVLEGKPEETPKIPGVLRAKPGEVYGVFKIKSDKLNKLDDKKVIPSQPESRISKIYGDSIFSIWEMIFSTFSINYFHL